MDNNKEIISVHVGQAGVQSGLAMWELLLKEHEVLPDGNKSQFLITSGENTSTYFTELDSGRFVPRAVFVDMDSLVIENISHSKIGKALNKNNFIKGKEDTSSIFARGCYDASSNHVQQTLERIEAVAESCENLQGITLTHSINGGCGSGFTAALMAKLKAAYPKVPLINHVLVPSPQMSASVVEMYNSVLAMPSLMRDSALTVMYDNEALYKMYAEAAGSKAFCSYAQTNRLIAQVASSLTVGMRFTEYNDSPWSLNNLITNSVVHPPLHFLSPSLAPLIATNDMWATVPSISELTDCAFKPANTLHSLNREQGKYIACCSIYRGSVPVDDITAATAEHQPASDRAGKKTKPWVEGVPRGFKGATARKSAVPFDDEPISVGDRSLCMLTNHTGLASTFALMGKKYDAAYSTRAFVFWYVGEGMEEAEFNESRECLDKLVGEYQAL